jgi:hypothetical protein
MDKFSFTGDLIFKEGPPIHDCEVSGTIAANGSVNGVVVITRGQILGPQLLHSSSFDIQGTAENTVKVAISAAHGSNLKIENSGCSFSFRARSVQEIPYATTPSHPVRVLYELTNLEFMGLEITERRDSQHVSLRRDRLRFLCGDCSCELQQIEDYDAVIEQLRTGGGSGVTYTLAVESLSGQVLEDTKTDPFADAVCELLSLASKNSVRWVRRTSFAATRVEIQSTTRSVGKLSSFQSGWSLIPDWVATEDRSARHELSYFLGSVTALYVQNVREQGLGLAIAWMLDSEHQSTIDMKFVAAFIAIERLRTKFLDRAALPASIVSDWNERIDAGLGSRILSVVKETCGALNEQQMRLIISRIRSANTPPAALELEALCRQLKVVGFDKEMTELRNKLVHTGGYGDFQFPDAIELYRKLSHIVDVCILRLLEFDGFYNHWATDWKPKSLKAHTDSGPTSVVDPSFGRSLGQ